MVILQYARDIEEPEIWELKVDLGSRKTRFIKVVAANISLLPDWQMNARSKVWLFIDEIVLQ